MDNVFLNIDYLDDFDTVISDLDGRDIPVIAKVPVSDDDTGRTQMPVKGQWVNSNSLRAIKREVKSTHTHFNNLVHSAYGVRVDKGRTHDFDYWKADSYYQAQFDGVLLDLVALRHTSFNSRCVEALDDAIAYVASTVGYGEAWEYSEEPEWDLAHYSVPEDELDMVN